MLSRWTLKWGLGCKVVKNVGSLSYWKTNKPIVEVYKKNLSGIEGYTGY